ncbi:MAG: hypothetical protein V7638_3841 [Acidobacteriota bacterium]|jgi:hypothetical protein
MKKEKPTKQEFIAALSLPIFAPYHGTATSDDPSKLIVRLDAVRRDPENARLHPDRNITGLRASLRRPDRGQVTPIVVDRDGVIAKGNGTHEAAELEGWEYIWVVTTGMTGMELRAYGISDNQTGLTSQWDENRLPAHLRDLRSWVPDDENVAPFSDEDFGVFAESEPTSIFAHLDDSTEDLAGQEHEALTTVDANSPPAQEKKPREVKPPPPDAADRARNDLAINGITPNMREIINQAFEKVRYVCADQSLTEGRCLELICADYLAGN